MFNFKVSTSSASILSLKTSDLLKLSKFNLELDDVIKSLKTSIKKHRKNDFDFFRFYTGNP